MPDVTVLAASAIVRVQSWKPALQPPAAFATISGTPWPMRVGTSGGSGACVLCLGPSEWFVISDSHTREALVRELEAAAAGTDFCIVDVSQSLRGLELRDPLARDLLSKACGLDLHPSVFTAGMCARTRLAGIGSIVRCADDGQTFTCFVARSHLHYIVDWLTDAAAEFASGSP